jgi:hypothetical protein
MQTIPRVPPLPLPPLLRTPRQLPLRLLHPLVAIKGAVVALPPAVAAITSVVENRLPLVMARMEM